MPSAGSARASEVRISAGGALAHPYTARIDPTRFTGAPSGDALHPYSLGE
ncbi:hypothetical protein [Azospirillum melinis]